SPDRPVPGSHILKGFTLHIHHSNCSRTSLSPALALSLTFFPAEVYLYLGFRRRDVNRTTGCDRVRRRKQHTNSGYSLTATF
ncbi:hypothetical protein WG66_002515, partial [Moniliophthora roreri]